MVYSHEHAGRATGGSLRFIWGEIPVPSRPLRGIVGKLEQVYAKQRAKRKEPTSKDLMNLRRIIRDEELPGGRQATESSAFLPALV